MDDWHINAWMDRDIMALVDDVVRAQAVAQCPLRSRADDERDWTSTGTSNEDQDGAQDRNDRNDGSNGDGDGDGDGDGMMGLWDDGMNGS